MFTCTPRRRNEQTHNQTQHTGTTFRHLLLHAAPPAIVNRQSPTTASQPSPKHLCTPKSLSPTLTPSHPPFFPHFPHTLHAHRTHTHLIPLSPSPLHDASPVWPLPGSRSLTLAPSPCLASRRARPRSGKPSTPSALSGAFPVPAHNAPCSRSRHAWLI